MLPETVDLRALALNRLGAVEKVEHAVAAPELEACEREVVVGVRLVERARALKLLHGTLEQRQRLEGQWDRGDDVSTENFGFSTKKSLVIWGDQMIRKGFLRPLERILLHSPLMVWAPFASNVYHDAVWYPTIGQARIREFMNTEWGKLFRKY